MHAQFPLSPPKLWVSLEPDEGWQALWNLALISMSMHIVAYNRSFTEVLGKTSAEEQCLLCY